MKFYIDESIALFFEAKDKEGNPISINDYEKRLVVFSKQEKRVILNVEETGASTFKALVTSENTRFLGAGKITAILTLKKEEEVRIATSCLFTLQKVEPCGCHDFSFKENVIDVSMCIENSNINISVEIGQTIVDSSNGAGIVLGQWEADKQAIAEAISLQGVPTEPTDPGSEMAQKIRNFQLAVPGDPSLVAPPVSYPDLWTALYNNQRAGYGAMWGILYTPCMDVALSGADAYLTSDGDFITSSTVYEFREPWRPNWVIYYTANEEIPTLHINTANSPAMCAYMYKGRTSDFNLIGGYCPHVVMGDNFFWDAITSAVNMTGVSVFWAKNSPEEIRNISNTFPLSSTLRVLYLGRLKGIYNVTGAFTGLSVSVFRSSVETISGGTNNFINNGVERFIFDKLTYVSHSNLFYTPSKLKVVEMPSIITFLGSQMFRGASLLKYLFLPATNGGEIGDAWGGCFIEDLELGEGFSKPINLQSLTTVTDRALFRDHFIDRLGETTEAHVVRLNATFNALLTAEDIQAITDKGYIVQFP